MNILVSVSSREQYENNKTGYIFPTKINKNSFYDMLNLLGPCVEEHPRYFIQLRNDDKELKYICFEIV